MATLLGGGICPICGKLCTTADELAQHKAWKPVRPYRTGQKLCMGTIRGERFQRAGSHVVQFRIVGIKTGWFTVAEIANWEPKVRAALAKQR